MKKFVWKLQQLLTLKEKQEIALRSEIVALTEQTMVLRGRMMALQMKLRAHQQDIQSLPEEERIAAQALYLQHAPVVDAVLRQLEEQRRALEERRRKKLDDYLQVQKFRKGLERLREKARREYEYEVNLEEQKQLDDFTHTNWNRSAVSA
jgi:flagellar biosynthesis chaperone FliJ